MRFRYQLEGFDEGWIDAGTRRQAFYTNLPPRAYRFRVAAGHSGVWGPADVAWEFSIEPRFHQTGWFYLACGLMASAVMAGAWRFRVLRIRREAAAVLGERMRISRELHDTLLQSLVGISMQFEDLSRKAAASPEGFRDHVERLRKQIRFYVHDARRSVLDLRFPVLDASALDVLLRDGGARMTGNQPLGFEVAVEGAPHPPLSREIKAQLFRIGQEALGNAVRHADASSIRVEIRYDPGHVRLRVVDDGRGFDLDTVNGYATNHWGLASMKERAQQIGGVFRLTSRPGAGTVVEVNAPLKAREEAHR